MAKPCLLAQEAAARVLRRRVQALRKPIEAARAEDADGIHDLRVASRRLRAAFAEHGAVLSARPLKSLRKEVRAITQGLGVARELDVTLGIIEARRREFQGAARLAIIYTVRRLRKERREHASAVARAADVADAPEFARNLMALFESLGVQQACYVKEASASLRGQYQAIYRLYGLWRGVPSDEVLHRIRVCLKKFRYACESYEPLYGPPMKDFLQQLKAAQEALGTWNDYRIVRDRLRAIAPEAPPRAKEGLPVLIAAFEENVAVSLDAFAESARESFSHVRTRETLEFLAHPEMSCCRSAPLDFEMLDAAY